MSTAPLAQEKTPITKTTVILGTATPGGGFPVYGAAVVEIVNAADFLRNPDDPRDATSSRSPIPVDEFVLEFVKPREIDCLAFSRPSTAPAPARAASPSGFWWRSPRV